jgi:hypothetical protein
MVISSLHYRKQVHSTLGGLSTSSELYHNRVHCTPDKDIQNCAKSSSHKIFVVLIILIIFLARITAPV